MAGRLRSTLIAALVLGGCGAGVDMRSQVKTQAARDLSCGEDQTEILDAEAGVYRISGCGLEASYHCTEDARFSARCQRLYLSKTADPAHKPQTAPRLAKSQ